MYVGLGRINRQQKNICGTIIFNNYGAIGIFFGTKFKTNM